MNYRSKIFIFSGIYALLAIFIAKKLFFSFNYGDDGINQLPVSLFEYILFALVFLTLVLNLLTMSFLIKKEKQPIGFKKRFHLLIPSFMGLVILFLLVKMNYSNLVVPVAIILYGLILLNMNRFVTSRLLILAITIIALGIFAFFFISWQWELLILVFGILPIFFGILIKLRPSRHS